MGESEGHRGEVVNRWRSNNRGTGDACHQNDRYGIEVRNRSSMKFKQYFWPESLKFCDECRDRQGDEWWPKWCWLHDRDRWSPKGVSGGK